jgi:hypothetical protein
MNWGWLRHSSFLKLIMIIIAAWFPAQMTSFQFLVRISSHPLSHLSSLSPSNPSWQERKSSNIFLIYLIPSTLLKSMMYVRLLIFKDLVSKYLCPLRLAVFVWAWRAMV